MVTGLAEFAAARLGELEAVAKAAANADGDARPNWAARFGMVVDADDPDYAIYGAALSSLPEIDQHIALNDPARVLREVAAGRAILEDYEDPVHCSPDPLYFIALEQALCHLAAIWSDHPDYDRGWAP